MVEDRANNPKRTAKIPGVRDIFSARVINAISNEEGHELNKKWVDERTYMNSPQKSSMKYSESKRGDKNPRSRNNPAFKGSRNDPDSPNYANRGK
jgi:hypothetical protein